MALVKCPDCGREISDTAPTCLQCGRQMVATTVEQTSKTIKGVRAGGCLAVPAGLMLMVIGGKTDLGFLSVLGVLGMLGGMIAYVGAGLAKWWKHE
jgi:hypothetical protein